MTNTPYNKSAEQDELTRVREIILGSIKKELNDFKSETASTLKDMQSSLEQLNATLSTLKTAQSADRESTLAKLESSATELGNSLKNRMETLDEQKVDKKALASVFSKLAGILEERK